MNKCTDDAVQCQIELPKLMSELDSNQLVTSSLLSELETFLDNELQLIDNYQSEYTAGNTSLEAVANGIPYDVITATVGTKKAINHIHYYFNNKCPDCVYRFHAVW